MTKYTIAVEEKQYKIDVTKTENQEHFTVKIDDEPYKLELTGKFEYDTPVQIKLGEKTFTIQIAKKEKQASFEVKIKDIPVQTEVKTQQINSLSQPTTARAPTLIAVKTPSDKIAPQGAIRAPMAGKIVSVKVKKEDAVKAGEVVCILEAMKMENEIVAQKDGFVKEIFVSTGSVVDKGDPLFVIEPSED